MVEFQFARNAAADEIAQGINRWVRNAVIDTYPAAFPCHQPVLGQQRQMARYVGISEATQVSQFANAALALP